MKERISITWLVSLWNALWLLPHKQTLLDDISQGLAGQGLVPPPQTWRVQHYNMSLSSMTVLSLGPSPDSLQAIVYISNSDQAARNFEQRANFLSYLNEEGSLSDWKRYISHILYRGSIKRHPYWVMKRLPGILASNVIHDNRKFDPFINNASSLISRFHRETSTVIVVGEKELADWIFTPVDAILRSKLILYARNCRAILGDLSASLSRGLSGREMAVSWTHGDYWPENILVSPDDMTVTGIIDWEQAKPRSLPSLDLVNLMVSSRRGREHREMGNILVELLQKGHLYPYEKKIWDEHFRLLDGKTPDLQVALLLFWIQHVASLLQKRNIYLFNPVWIKNNFIRVVNWLEENAPLV